MKVKWFSKKEMTDKIKKGKDFFTVIEKEATMQKIDKMTKKAKVFLIKASDDINLKEDTTITLKDMSFVKMIKIPGDHTFGKHRNDL